MRDVAVVVVSYNSREVLDRCLEPLGDEELDLIVVDNASTDGGPAYVRQTFPRTRIVELPVNRGFGAAVNAGVAMTTRPFVVVLNADVWAQPRALAELVQFASEHADAGLVGPRLVGLDGDVQVTAVPFPTRFWLGRPAVTSFPGTAAVPEPPRGRFFVVAAAFLARRTALLEVGGFDEAFFMFGEDIDLSYRMLQAGWSIELCRSAQVVHLGGHSTRQAWGDLYREQLRSHLRFLAKHRGMGAAETARLVLALALGTRSFSGSPDSRRLLRATVRWLMSGRTHTLIRDDPGAS